MNSILTGFLVASIIGAIALKAKALTRSGAIAAALVGTAVFGCGGLKGSLILIAFFLTGSALTKLPGAKIKEESGRDWKQVMANGAIPAITLVLSKLIPRYEVFFVLLFLGSLATAAADTWATEIGTRYGGTARDVVYWKKVPSGLSGGVTFAGILASALGAMMIATIAILPISGLGIGRSSRVWTGVLLSGIFAGLFDSFFGSVFQAKYWCDTCGKIFESTPHSHEMTLLKGVSWMTNSMVNFITVILGGLVAAFLA